MAALAQKPLIAPNTYLHAGQMEVWRHPARFKVVVAGRRWGKSTLSMNTLIVRAAIPNQKVWYVAPSYSMAKEIMFEELKEQIPRAWVTKVHETDMSIRLTNGSMIQCKGADSPDSLRGRGLDYLVLDEYQDMKKDTWTRILRPTLAKSRGHCLFIGTPKGFNNLYDVYALGIDEKNTIWKSWQFPTITSPFIPEDEIESARRDLDSKSFEQEFMASFQTMSGLVYYEFDRNVHVRECPIDPTLPIWIGADFNVDPMTNVIMQPQRNGEVWAVDEIYMRNSSTVQVCDELERRYWRYMDVSPPQITVFPDPAGGSRQHARGESDLDIYRDKGFTNLLYKKKHPPVADRVNSVNRMLMNAMGDVNFYIDPSCKNTIESFEQTLYKEGTRDVDKRPSMEHLTDALGYCLHFKYPSKKLILAGRSL